VDGFALCLCALTLALILVGTSSAFVMRIDGEFEDWKDVTVCASDPKGDATGVFDITRVYAASQGTILYLRFDTANLFNLQNGPASEGTLLVLLDLPDNRRATVETRGRQGFHETLPILVNRFRRKDAAVKMTYQPPHFCLLNRIWVPSLPATTMSMSPSASRSAVRICRPPPTCPRLIVYPSNALFAAFHT